MEQKIEFIDLGTMPYGPCLELQQQTFDAQMQHHLNQTAYQQTIYLVEHPHVYTLGKHGNQSNITPMAKSSGAELYYIDRGGDITYHGPGQIVVYPILNLNVLNIGIAQYVSILESIGVSICKAYGIEASTIHNVNGVWIEAETPRARKIMAIGIRASRGITMHGLAFNVNTDLKYFSYIVPCGLVDKGVTSLAYELNRPIDIHEVKSHIIQGFQKQLFDA